MEEEKIGYCNPPEATKFKKGQSGNPSGRPKGSRNFTTIVQKELGERVVINEGGKPKKLSKQEVIIKTVVNKAMAGDKKAFPLAITLMKENEAHSEQKNINADAISKNEREIIENFKNSLLEGKTEDAVDV